MCLTLLTPLCFALCAIYSANFQTQESDSLVLAAGMLLFSSLLLLPVVVMTHHFYLFNFPLQKVDRIIFLEIILSSTGYFLFFLLLKKAGPVYYSLVGGVVMLTGLFWGWLIFNETFTVLTTVSVVFILSGVYLVTLGQSKHFNH
jgi:drug/metabolite transporter (DMT)-like permease